MTIIKVGGAKAKTKTTTKGMTCTCEAQGRPRPSDWPEWYQTRRLLIKTETAVARETNC